MRLEYKYLMSASKFQKIKKEIIPYLILDKHAEKNKNKEYTVRSIYFDTPQLCYYFEKIEGIKDRKKIRVRVYDNYTSDSITYLEIKKKIENYVYKSRSQLHFCDLNKFFETSKFENLILTNENRSTGVENAKKFLFYLNKDNLQPIILITYDREPFLGKIDNGLRVTFDKNLRSLSLPNFCEFFEESKLRKVLKHRIILEVKFNGSFPAWLKNIISIYGLQRMALSKYTICLEADKKLNIPQLNKRLAISNKNQFYKAFNIKEEIRNALSI